MNGIETHSSGHTFRSRLEARWAEMFTLLGWRWEYEPFDAKGYIPDFVLLGDDPVLVEVKPALTLAEYHQPVDKIERSLLDVWDHDILIVGVSPLPTIKNSWAGCHPPLGLLGEWQKWEDETVPLWAWDPACWSSCGSCGITSFFHDIQSYRNRLCGHHDGDHYLADERSDLADLWGQAHARTRWKP